MDEVWYVSYGSNMSRARLLCYLQGGCPPGARRTYPGARDRRPPRASVPAHLPGRIYFSGESATWGGGMAFYDHDLPGPTPARAYRVTVAQFADIAAQEMRREPAAGTALEQVLTAGFTGIRHRTGPGRYETLVHAGERDGLAMLTFTSPDGAAATAHTVPSSAYLAMLAEGLREGHGWADEQIAAYLDSVLP